MRVIAGRWRGRTLVAPPGLATRPTADRVRGALFSMLASRLGSFEELAVADLFAGSGALGIEALSRGAARALFVEKDRAAVEAIRRNVGGLGAVALADVRGMDVMAVGAVAAPFDLVTMDPPYRSGLVGPVLARLGERGWIAPATLVAVETARGEDAVADGFAVVAVREHGAGRLTLLRVG